MSTKLQQQQQQRECAQFIRRNESGEESLAEEQEGGEGVAACSQVLVSLRLAEVRLARKVEDTACALWVNR